MSDIDNSVDPPNPESFPWPNGYSPVTLQIDTTRIPDGSTPVDKLLESITAQQDTIMNLTETVAHLLDVVFPGIDGECSPIGNGPYVYDHGTALIYTKQQLPEVVRFKIISKLCDYGPHKGSLEHDGVMYEYTVTDAGRVNRDSTR